MARPWVHRLLFACRPKPFVEKTGNQSLADASNTHALKTNISRLGDLC
ncbi:hypothetical protein [Stutzerimonas kirkiae]|nr:hypothetical protein [Stutzerimonas kirkiae]